MVAPPVHVHVLVVQIAFLLFAVVARVVPPVVWVGARVAPSTSTMGTIFILDLARHLFIRQKPRFILFIMPSLGPNVLCSLDTGALLPYCTYAYDACALSTLACVHCA